MRVNEIERIVISEVLKDRNMKAPTASEFSEMAVSFRTFTGRGFYSGLDKHQALFVGQEEGKEGKEGEIIYPTDIDLEVNQISTGYVCYLKSGYLTTIEGYTYVEEWPDPISSVKHIKH